MAIGLSKSRVLWGLSLGLCAILLTSCAAGISSPRTVRSLDAALAARNIPAALEIVEKPDAYKNKERLLYYLDAGMLHHYNGDWEQSNILLQEAEDAIAELYTKSVSRGAASMLISDNVLEYSGEDYEDVYINVFKALNYLKLGDIDGAFVEIRRMDDKLSHLEQKYARLAKEMNEDSPSKVEIKPGKTYFHSSALARYLSMALYDEARQRDSARIDYDNVFFAFRSQPEIYPFSPPRIVHPHQSSQEPLLRIISFVNRGPYKRARELHIHSSENLLLIGSVRDKVEVMSIFWPGIDEGYYFKFAIPKLMVRNPRVGRIDAVMADDRRYNLQKLEDLSLVAQRTFEAKEPMIMLKSVSRTVLKGLAAERAKKEVTRSESSLGASLLSLAVDAAVLFSENADLRLSQFFPKEAYLAEIPLPDCDQEIRIEYFSTQGNLMYSESYQYEAGTAYPKLISTWCF